MHVPRRLILAGMLAAGGFLGWAMNAYSEEAAELLLAASDSVDPRVGQPAEAHGGEKLVIVIADRSAAPPPAAATDGETAEAAGVDAAVPETADWASGGSAETVGVAAHAWHAEAEPAPTAPEGDHIVVTHDDSIVLVGDHGRLTGNTGDAGKGGIVALDAQESAFKTSLDAAEGAALPQGAAGTLTTSGPESGPQARATTVTGNGAMAAPSSGKSGHVRSGKGGQVPNAPPGVVSPLISPIVSFSHGRQVDMAGYEDHSLSVRGRGQIVTYDDSNVFIDRNGKINANTGDLDSAGLNAVDTLRSNIAAGPHCDDGCDDESVIQAQAGVFDEGDVALHADGNPVWAPDAGAGNGDTDDGEDGDNGDEDDAEEDDGDVFDPADTTREAADTTREAAGTGVDPREYPSGDDFLVIGGDGYDDLGIRADGTDNILTYDDSNVVLGGTGNVNAQIGDADTGGAALMETVDSLARGGNSR